ncbi:MAG TPA: 4Fe-4S dicluster domain-containing protein [Coriobacteriia bacterium]|jgi:protein NrfC
MSDKEAKEPKQYSRREFVTGIGGLGFGAVLGGMFVKGLLLPDKTLAIPASEGYLLVDTKKCAGCTSCMLACSLVHHGETSLSLSRMQIVNDPFAAFPGGVTQEQCRQCPFPACVEACPTGANHVDTAHGNVRTIDAAKCIGCERCINACPFEPARVQWNAEEKHAQKCDLCANAPFWNEKGGVGGKQACIEICPLHAIKFSKDVPIQNADGYTVNLRKNVKVWRALGFPDGDAGEFTYKPGQSAGGG